MGDRVCLAAFFQHRRSLTSLQSWRRRHNFPGINLSLGWKNRFENAKLSKSLVGKAAVNCMARLPKSIQGELGLFGWGWGAACLVAKLPRWAGRAGLQALCPSKLAACCPSQLPNKEKERMAGPSRVHSAGANGLASLGFGVGRGNMASSDGIDAH